MRVLDHFDSEEISALRAGDEFFWLDLEAPRPRPSTRSASSSASIR